MNPVKIFVDVFGVGMEAVAFFVFFEAVMKNSRVKQRTLFGVYLSFFVFASLAVSFIGFAPALLGSMFVFTFLLTLYYESGYAVKVFTAVLLSVMGALTEVIAGLFLVVLTQKSVEVLSENMVYYIQGVLYSKALFLTFAKVVQYAKMPSRPHLKKSMLLPLLSLPLTTVFIIYTMSEYAYSFSDAVSVTAVAIAATMLIVTNLLVFYLFGKQLRLDDQAIKSGLIQQQLRHQSQYFKDMADKYKVSNKTVHDTKNQLFAVSIALGNNEVDKAKSKIDELCRNAFGDANTIKTGNDALDALLNTKYRDLDAQGIRLNHNIVISSTNSIDDIDLCIVVGNALDNAIEACLRGGEGGVIELTMKQTADYLAMEMSNPAKDEPLTSKGKLITRKENRALHGFGLQSIEEIAEKYEGHVSHRYENGIFTLKVTLRNSL